MQKILPIILAAAVFLTPLYPVYAQTNARPINARTLKEGTDGAALKPVGLNVALTRVKNATAEARLKQALARFKDKNKAKRVENVSQNLNTLNSRLTSNMKNALERISGMIERIKNKTKEAAGEGKDVASINSAISNAEIEWSQADAAVSAQSEKDYSIVINTEKTVASDAAAARNSLRTDIKATHTQVVEARQALANAIRTAMSALTGGNNGSN